MKANKFVLYVVKLQRIKRNVWEIYETVANYDWMNVGTKFGF